jgi:ATP-dependent DNA helicase RecG
MKLPLNTPVSEISRVGKTVASRLKKLGIETIEDLIFYYPFRWEDFSRISEIKDLQPGQVVTVKVKIQLIKSRRSPVKKKILTEALVGDDDASIKVIWFNQPFLSKILSPGQEVYLSGKIDYDGYNLQVVNPIYEKVGATETTHTARLVPIYSLTSNITQKQIRFLIHSVLPNASMIKDWLPPSILKRYNLLPLSLALNQIHFPKNQEIINKAIRRLKFDDLFLFQLQVLASRKELDLSKSLPLNFFQEKTKQFVESLPFKLTDDQRQAAWQIISDLTKIRPMNRLLEGDVGSGKTVVAALAMLNCIFNKRQSVFLAPTEILAQQHYKTILNLLGNLGDQKVNIAILTRSESDINQVKVKKTEIKQKLKSGEIDIIVGTHALIQEEVIFQDLALAIVDEQHRFGVNQRKLLRQKSGKTDIMPHLLSMTATPIPRSLALALYGDLDLSIIKEMPKERKKIITRIVDSTNRSKAYEFVREQIKAGHQVFVVCPLIDPSDKLGVKAATEEYERLKNEIFPDLRISLLHGRLKSVEKEKVMSDFLAKNSDILVATAVIEVGVDVPNATVVLIEGAERFGLAQLHQFRGRVGRSVYQSYCFLFTEKSNQKTKDRLAAILTAKDGFELAELDLKLRGPGEVYGTIQSGFPEFKIAQLTDVEIIKQAKDAANDILADGFEKYPLLKQKMSQFIKTVHLE